MSDHRHNMTRRDFLTLAGKSAVVSSGLLAGCATTATTSPSASHAIDIHHHYFAPELIDEIKKHGKALGGIEHFPPKQAKDNPYRRTTSSSRCRRGGTGRG